MSLSQLTRLVCSVGVAVWLAVPSVFGVSPERKGLLQGDSPIPNPLDSPIATDPFGLAATPVPDPAQCSSEAGCPDSTAPAPGGTAEFTTFLPGVGQQPGQPADQPPSASPDLGALLNYAAIGVIVIGVTLKVYWFIADRRKAR